MVHFFRNRNKLTDDLIFDKYFISDRVQRAHQIHIMQ